MIPQLPPERPTIFESLSRYCAQSEGEANESTCDTRMALIAKYVGLTDLLQNNYRQAALQFAKGPFKDAVTFAAIGGAAYLTYRLIVQRRSELSA